MVKTEYIQTLDDLPQIIFEQEYDNAINRHRSSFLYRGMPNESYLLAASLQKKKKDLEKSILRNFTKYAANDDQQLKESIWRQLIIGQHHGLPTRLLDWTYSSLIGFHFATSGEDLSQMDEHNGVLWKIDINEVNNILPDPYIEKLKEERDYLFTVEMLNSLVDSLDQYDSDMENRSMVLIEPQSIDQRIINQYSYFSIIPEQVVNIEEFFETKTSNTVRYIIDKELKWRIRDMLD